MNKMHAAIQPKNGHRSCQHGPLTASSKSRPPKILCTGPIKQGTMFRAPSKLSLVFRARLSGHVAGLTIAAGPRPSDDVGPLAVRRVRRSATGLVSFVVRVQGGKSTLIGGARNQSSSRAPITGSRILPVARAWVRSGAPFLFFQWRFIGVFFSNAELVSAVRPLWRQRR